MPEFPVIPGYRIEKELGQGGMATVYLAVQEKLNRKVAIKVLSPLLLLDKQFSQRFLKEAETAANLGHPNIVTIFDVGQSENNFYIVMEWLGNGNLKERIARDGRPGLQVQESLAVVRQIAGALEYAHGEGFIHRDIKADNILFRKDGTAVLTDFGIAKAVDSATRLTRTGMSIGTPHYMSPEQIRGFELDGRADIYSLGIVFYEMLAGKVPFDATDTIAIAMKHVQEPIPQLSGPANPYQSLLDKMLAKEPKDRFQNGRELQAVIDGFSGGVRTHSGTDRAVPLPDQSRSPFTPGKTIPRSATEGAHPHPGTSNFVPLQETGATAEKKGNHIVPWLVGSLVVLVVILVAVLSNNNSDVGARHAVPSSDPVPTLQNTPSDASETQRMRDQLAAAEAEKKRLAAVLEQNEDQEREHLTQLEEQRRQSAKADRLRDEEVARQKQEEVRVADAAMSTSSDSGNLRSSYRMVSDDQAKDMAKRLGIYLKDWNPSASGISHQYKSGTISHDLVVVDFATGLMWHQSGSDEYLNYADAQVWLADLNRRGYAGYSDWRLPTLEEGSSLLESWKKNGDLYIDPVFSNTQKYIWTGDSFSSAGSWVVSFSSCGVYGNFHGSYFYVRPVRSGR